MTYRRQARRTTCQNRFQWQREDGSWDGGWVIEPVPDLLARMNRGGPYKYTRYRITEASKPELVILPTCVGCGMLAGLSCGNAHTEAHGDPLAEPLIDYDEYHQFAVSLPTVIEGRNYGKARAKQMTFNS